MPKRSLIALFAALALLLAGCGSDDKDESSSATTTSTTVPPDPKVDKDRAQKIVLTQGDVPGGFTQTEEAKETTTDAEEYQLDQCIGLNTDASLVTADWSGATFTNEQNSISSAAEFKKSAGDARADLEAIKTEKARNCLRDMVEKAMKSEIGNTAQVTATVVNMDKLVSPDNAFVRAKASVNVEGVTIDAYFDLIGTVVDRALVSQNYVYIGGEPPLDVESSNLDKLRQRARDLQGIK